MNEPQNSDIRIEYHEKSGRAAKMSRLKDYLLHEPVKVQPLPHNLAFDSKPWSPFKSLADFEFAEVALEAALNKNQIEKLIKITRHCINGDDVFNLASHKEICEIWTDASAMVSPVSASYIFQAFPIFNNSLLKFTRYELTASHKGHELVFDFWCRSLWDWVLDLVGMMGQILYALSTNPGLQTDFGMFR